MPKIVSRAEFAKLAGVGKSAITEASKPGGLLAAARVGKSIDAEHPDCVAYLKRSTRRRTKRRIAEAEASQSDPDLVAEHDADTAAELAQIGHMTIQEVVDEFGTKHAFAHWLDALKRMEDIRKLRLSNDETEGALIRRDFVKTYLFGAVDAMTRRLLNDLPATAVANIYAAARAGEPIENAERALVGLIGDTLKPFATTMEKRLEVASK